VYALRAARKKCVVRWSRSLEARAVQSTCRTRAAIDLHLESGALVGSVVWKYAVLGVHQTRAR
jgi:hypothetical protein